MSLLFISSCKDNSKKLVENVAPTVEKVTPTTALQSYLNNNDQTYKWELKENYPIGDVTAYELLLTSQKWREHVWTHELTVLVPKEVAHDGALLMITGGSIKEGIPNWSSNEEDKKSISFAQVAEKNKAIVAIVRQVPNQPLYDGLTEDELISFTLHNYKKDKDLTWPLLFPMVKSATRAMDAVQEFSSKNLQKEVTRFTVTGASKRGWTTWLSGANDKRVETIAPMVIDVLNMPVSLDYQITAWNEYSVQINDYINLEIPQTVRSEDGEALTQMVDPYSYRANLTMPKLIFIGTNDEYWPVDAIKNYINDIPGENYIHYVPNAGHDLGGGEQAVRALSAFWGKSLNKTPQATLAYNLTTDKTSATLTVKTTSDELKNAYIWSADSSDRDFRDEEWTSEKINSKDHDHILKQVKFPKSGFKAFYIDLEYADPNGGKYTKSTRMYVADDDEIL
ncbi:PhoPQ-activated pathogenicity-like protein PqaA type [Arenibacter sp. BSSL-BM3]|uniref:PhoPQ-activated pathogenicity-like protein PqaA type n=2 Tax=Arenibacter arenosicollis TaxID=2762274 RepID=A0ABR7QRZ9_9FLAO|nr:PhoPQ-activated pathogenicity-like protein PqaA type [Arenibacter arenosicollis]